MEDVVLGKPSGWANPVPFSSRSKFHYWFEGEERSLCGSWRRGFVDVGDYEEGADEHLANCKLCVKRKLAHVVSCLPSIRNDG